MTRNHFVYRRAVLNTKLYRFTELYCLFVEADSNNDVIIISFNWSIVV